eukprot:4795441-Amphidinium_carterae.1
MKQHTMHTQKPQNTSTLPGGLASQTCGVLCHALTSSPTKTSLATGGIHALSMCCAIFVAQVRKETRGYGNS